MLEVSICKGSLLRSIEWTSSMHIQPDTLGWHISNYFTCGWLNFTPIHSLDFHLSLVSWLAKKISPLHQSQQLSVLITDCHYCPKIFATHCICGWTTWCHVPKTMCQKLWVQRLLMVWWRVISILPSKTTYGILISISWCHIISILN